MIYTDHNIMKVIEKWNGVLSQATGGGAMPLIDLDHVAKKIIP